MIDITPYLHVNIKARIPLEWHIFNTIVFNLNWMQCLSFFVNKSEVNYGLLLLLLLLLFVLFVCLFVLCLHLATWLLMQPPKVNNLISDRSTGNGGGDIKTAIIS
jgi:hypothetical protein